MSEIASSSIDNAATYLIDVRINRLARERLADLQEQDDCNLKFWKGIRRAFLLRVVV